MAESPRQIADRLARGFSARVDQVPRTEDEGWQITAYATAAHRLRNLANGKMRVTRPGLRFEADMIEAKADHAQAQKMADAYVEALRECVAIIKANARLERHGTR